tara:strand:- start:3953 stop:4315 length:363 start_codon:yes stop_codon:yes gene_type:complete
MNVSVSSTVNTVNNAATAVAASNNGVVSGDVASSAVVAGSFGFEISLLVFFTLIPVFMVYLFAESLERNPNAEKIKRNSVVFVVCIVFSFGGMFYFPGPYSPDYVINLADAAASGIIIDY